MHRPVFVFIDPARILIDPLEYIQCVPHPRRDRQSLELQNLGDETLWIERINSSVSWARPLCKNVEVDPKQRTYVDVFVDGDGLAVGKHTAQLEIVSNSYGGVVRVPIHVFVHEASILQDPIGVDFGTSLSCVATVQDGNPVMVDITLRTPLIPLKAAVFLRSCFSKRTSFRS